MIRSELIKKLRMKIHIFSNVMKRIVNTIFEEITDALANGDRVELRVLALFQ